MKLSRRTFLQASASAAAASIYRPKPGYAQNDPSSLATLIDITRCDGCSDLDQPLCVSACRAKNQKRFPQPDPAMLKDYWPKKGFEDWSDKAHIDSRLTPYNWLFVEEIYLQIDGQDKRINIPRRCMHCNKPACVEYCPFGTAKKDPVGPVYIEQDLCFGGAKCRTVCPWNVPQRQAGVGIYTQLDPIPVGGGSMFKCDLCRDLLANNTAPACIDACPKQVMDIGPREQIEKLAKKRAKAMGGYIYGIEENGGTATIYLSAIPFAKYDKYLLEDVGNPNRVMRFHQPEQLNQESNKLGLATFFMPLLAALVAFVSTGKKTRKGKNKDD